MKNNVIWWQGRLQSSVLLPGFSHGQEHGPRGSQRVWFEGCPIFDSEAFKCSPSGLPALCCTFLSACMLGGRPLGQVSYCQDCSLNTPSNHHTHGRALQAVHYCAYQPSVQSILPPQQAHMWWKAKDQQRRKTAKVKKGCWREEETGEKGRKAVEEGSVSDGESRARGQRVKEQGKEERWQEKCPETRDKQHRERESECGSRRWRTEMRSGRAGMENRGPKKEKVCMWEWEMERGRGWMRRMLYVMAEV